MTFQTVFGSLEKYEKGHIELINDNPKYYVFSNVFEVANQSKPWEKVAVAKNLEYVIEAIRADPSPVAGVHCQSGEPLRSSARHTCALSTVTDAVDVATRGSAFTVDGLGAAVAAGVDVFGATGTAETAGSMRGCVGG